MKEWQTAPNVAYQAAGQPESRGRRVRRALHIAAMTLSAVNACVGAFMLALSYYMATNNALEFYPSTRYIMYQAGAAAVVGLAGTAVRFVRFPALLLSSAAIALLFVPWYYASEQWPGGDDGGGLGWFFIVGAGCLVSFLVGLGSGITGIVLGIVSLRRR